MTQLFRIVYISRSLPARPGEAKVEPDIGQILQQSRQNNPSKGLCGVLYYGDDCFFQCIEGEEEKVDALYAILLADPRHQDICLLSKTPITSMSFSGWSMKYVPLNRAMKRLLLAHGQVDFDPYRFDDAMVERVIELLQNDHDPLADSRTNMPPPKPGR
jgi:hypothetical protein